MKKWTYLLAAGLLAGASPVFTGCIDNDEPEGISILRGAKAELLKAKAAVEAARIAEVEANAALLKAQATVEQAKVAKVQAEAEKIKAEAKIAEAEAAYWAAQTETERAAAQAIIEENERIQKEWEERAAVRAAEAEAAIKEAEYKALEAKTRYEQALINLVGSQQLVLQPYMARVQTLSDKYFDVLEEVRVAQRKVNTAKDDVAYAEKYKELNTRELQMELNLKNAALVGAEATKKDAEKELEEAKGLTQHPLQDKLQSVEEEMTKIRKEIANLSVQAAEKVKEFYESGRFSEVEALYKTISEMEEAEHEIAAVEFDFGDGAGYPTFVSRTPVKLEAAHYSLKDAQAFVEREALLQKIVKEFRSWTRDANDDEWNAEYVAELKAELDGFDVTSIKPAQKAWEEAVAAYHTNKYNETDPSKISGYAELVKGIDEVFNPAVDALNTAIEKKIALEAEEKKDAKTLAEALEENEKDQEAAKGEAEAKKQTGLDNINTTVENKQKKLKEEVDNAKRVEESAKKAYDEYTGTDANVAQGLYKAWQNAIKKTEAAVANQAAYGGHAEEIENIEKAYKEAEAKWKADKLKADNAANKAYNDKWDTEKGTKTAELNAAKKDITAKKKVLDDAAEATKDLAEVYNSNISEIEPINTTDIDNAVAGVWDADKKYVVRQKLDIKALLVLDKQALKNVVIARSNALYGSAYYEEKYGDDVNARLEPYQEGEIEKLIAEQEIKSLEDYLNECEKYGLMGERIALAEKLRIAESWTGNAEKINAKIKQADEALKALKDAYEKAGKELEAKNEEAKVATDKLVLDLEAAKEPVEAKRQELLPLFTLQNAYWQAIMQYVAAGEKVWSTTTIENYTKLCQAAVETAEIERYNAETDVMQAQKNLEEWNSETLDALKLAEKKLQNANAKAERYRQQLKEAQEALEAMIASLSAE